MIEEFFEFLKERNVLGKYLDDYTAYRDFSHFDDLLDDLDCMEITQYVSSTFIWTETLDGLDFWAEINEDWRNYLKYWEEELGEKWYENQI